MALMRSTTLYLVPRRRNGRLFIGQHPDYRVKCHCCRGCSVSCQYVREDLVGSMGTTIGGRCLALPVSELAYTDFIQTIFLLFRMVNQRLYDTEKKCGIGTTKKQMAIV